MFSKTGPSKWEFVNDSFIVFLRAIFMVIHRWAQTELKQNSVCSNILMSVINDEKILLNEKFTCFPPKCFFFHDKLSLYIWQLHQVRAKFVARFKFSFDCPVMKKGEDKWSWIKNVVVILCFKLILFIYLFSNSWSFALNWTYCHLLCFIFL